jgi:hypothetical protein
VRVSRRLLWSAVLLVAAATLFIGWQYSVARSARESLFDALTPVTLANCDLARYGAANDGGYLMCRNLIGRARAAYSYGIDGRDEWGCQVARELSIPLHQYDCYNTTIPPCPGTHAFFNAACVGPQSERIDGRLFEPIRDQVAKNEDSGKPLLMKMDVEGSEWASFLATPDDVFRNVDQLVVEFHGIERPKFVDVIERLKQFFYVANVHINNFSCTPWLSPFPGDVFEVLFVNKQIAQVASPSRPTRHHALDAPNATWLPDCQTLATTPSQFELFYRWLRRFARRAISGPRFVEA